MKRVLVLGLSVTGKSAAKFLKKRGYEVIGYDDKVIDFQEITIESNPDLKTFDWVLLSPGIPPSHPLYREAILEKKEIIVDIECALREMKQPVIAITGTNGKTTVTELTTYVLKQCGLKAEAVGNNGKPIFDWLEKKPPEDEIAVIELSSYQLETMSTKAIDAGVILNITPDHLDRYNSMEEYKEAKFRIALCMKEGGVLYAHEDQHFATAYQLYKEELGYSGRLNFEQENALASYLLTKRFGVTAQQFLKALATFKKPAHRLEFVATWQGVHYYNDSKGTNIDAVMKAVDVVPSPIILIAGGKDKGGSYAPWKVSFQGKVAAVCLIGEAKDKIEAEIGKQYKTYHFNTLQDAVRFGSSIAKEGGSVLLSPGCASFDMFNNYKERGEIFVNTVRSLQLDMKS